MQQAALLYHAGEQLGAPALEHETVNSPAQI